MGIFAKLSKPVRPSLWQSSFLKIFAFIVGSLFFWWLISVAVFLTYRMLPPFHPPEATASGILTSIKTALTMVPGNPAFFLLILPIGMLIAGLWVWPNRTQELETRRPARVSLKQVITDPEAFMGWPIRLFPTPIDKVTGPGSFRVATDGKWLQCVSAAERWEINGIDAKKNWELVGMVCRVNKDLWGEWHESSLIDPGYRGPHPEIAIQVSILKQVNAE